MGVAAEGKAVVRGEERRKKVRSGRKEKRRKGKRVSTVIN